MRSDILDDYVFDDFDAASAIIVAEHAPAGISLRHLYYHITNQTAAGESPEFPVLTDVVLRDLRVVQWYADGSSRNIALFDGDGTRADSLDTRMVFLESADNPPPPQLPVEAVCVAGRIEPTVLEVQTSPNGPVQVVRVRGEFLIDIVDPQPGAYLAITVAARDGNRYPVGTFGIVEVD